MKRLYLCIGLFILLSPLQGQNKKVIIDADTGNEIDDLPAVVLALKSGRVDVLALTSAQWSRVETCGIATMHESWLLNNQILDVLGRKNIPNLRGSEHAVGHGQHWGSKTGSAPNEASQFIVNAALGMPKTEKLVVIVTGSATNIASAILYEPKIVDRISVFFIGTTYDFKRKAFSKNEFNVRSDLNAVDVLFNTDGLELHVMPANICTNLKVSQKDMDTRLRTNEAIEGLFMERWKVKNPQGSDWTMWDIAIVQAVINPQWTKEALRKTPPENTSRKIYVYSEIDTAAMMEDFWSVFLK